MPGRLPCISTPCQSYQHGHNVHLFSARRVAGTPWQWRDGVVTAAHGETVGVGYVGVDHEVSLWHHEPLDDLLAAGDPVRVHEACSVLGGPFGWVSVVVTGGLGPLPEPAHPELFGAEVVVPVVDLSTGRAVPMDHER